MKPCEGCIKLAADLADVESRLARALQVLSHVLHTVNATLERIKCRRDGA
jgi:hypothetical protein